jgi:hypothetical protein
VTPVALVVSVAQMVLYLAGQSTTGGAAVTVPFTSMERCREALPFVLKQAAVAAAFCVDTSRAPLPAR